MLQCNYRKKRSGQNRTQPKMVAYLHKGGPGATPAVSEGKVVCLSRDGRLTAFETANGDEIWTHDLFKMSGFEKVPEWGFTGSPVIRGGRVYVEAGRTWTFGLAEGTQLWRSKPYGHAYGSAALFTAGGKELLATLKQEGLVVLDANNGKELARAEWKTKYRTNGTTPIVSGNQIFVSTGYKRGCALFELDHKKGTLEKSTRTKTWPIRWLIPF